MPNIVKFSRSNNHRFFFKKADPCFGSTASTRNLTLAVGFLVTTGRNVGSFTAERLQRRLSSAIVLFWSALTYQASAREDQYERFEHDKRYSQKLLPTAEVKRIYQLLEILSLISYSQPLRKSLSLINTRGS